MSRSRPSTLTLKSVRRSNPTCHTSSTRAGSATRSYSSCSLRPLYRFRLRVFRFLLFGELDALPLNFLLAVHTKEDINGYDLILELPVYERYWFDKDQASLILNGLCRGQVLFLAIRLCDLDELPLALEVPSPLEQLSLVSRAGASLAAQRSDSRKKVAGLVPHDRVLLRQDQDKFWPTWLQCLSYS